MSELAEAVMIAYCGWDPTTPVSGRVVKLDGNGTRLLVLPSLHVTAVSAVSVTEWDGTRRDLTAGDGGEIGWNQGGELEWATYGCWPVGKQNVSVTYSGGYTFCPDDLIAVFDSLTSRLPAMQAGVLRAKLGTAELTYAASTVAGDLLLVEKMVLDRYRIVRAA